MEDNIKSFRFATLYFSYIYILSLFIGVIFSSRCSMYCREEHREENLSVGYIDRHDAKLALLMSCVYVHVRYMKSNKSHTEILHEYYRFRDVQRIKRHYTLLHWNLSIIGLLLHWTELLNNIINWYHILIHLFDTFYIVVTCCSRHLITTKRNEVNFFKHLYKSVLLLLILH